ncbi:ABC transporter ATP-binding protein [Denitratimonas sp. CY0512]|uniref:ABC transporter ATP-binding protein n=1 Tax=Denitratimonas sp. CY0512 TaxID=3131940 RepID=UPI0030B58CA4
MTGEEDGRSPSGAEVDQGGLRLLFGLLRPYRSRLILILILLLAQNLVILVNPWLAGRFAGAVLTGAEVGGLLLAWFGLVAIQSVLAWISTLRLQATSALLVADIGTRVFDHIQSLPLGWHQDRSHGAVLSLLGQDVNRLGQFLVSTLTPLLPQLLLCVGAVGMMAAIKPWFAAAAALLVPAMYLGMRLAGRRLRPLGRQVVQGFADKHAVAGQSLSMLPVVKAYTGETVESECFRDRSDALHAAQVELARHSTLITPLVRLISAAAILVLLWLASGEVTTGALAPDELVSLLLYGLLLTQPVSSLAGIYGQMHVARGTAQRLFGVLSEAPEADDGHLVPAAVSGNIVYEQVVFRHPGRSPVMDGLNLVIRAGETVVITGRNGAGKSTLVSLLMRFVDPDSGRVLLDGCDLRDYDLRFLRASIGLVSQQVLLFDGTVRENIAYGLRDASQEQIEAAARLAQAHAFISALPQAYETRIGDRGIKLSGGQQQRVALARALLKDPAVLILDEATAMFDPEAEQAFIRDCHAMLRQRTIILIAHRPASLALADRVLRMEGGSLVEADVSTGRAEGVDRSC